MDAWIGWIKFKLQNGLSIQTHTASAVRASAVRASAVTTTADTASAVRASADTTTATTATAHYVQRMKGGRFRRGGCVCVSGDEQEKNGLHFKSKFNPTIHPSNLKFNYLRKKM